MSKILLCKNNVSSIREDASTFHRLYCQFFDKTFTFEDILNAVSVQFNYSNWAELKAVNFSTRYYHPFNLQCYSHSKHLAHGLARTMGVSDSSVKAILGLLNLGLTNKDDMYFTNGGFIYPAFSKGVIDKEKYVLWITDDTNVPEAAFSKNPEVALLVRRGMTIRNLDKWLPDTSLLLRELFYLDDDFVVMTNDSIFWGLFNDIHELSKDYSLFKLTINCRKHSSNESRTIYQLFEPFEKNTNVLEDIATTLAEGLPTIPDALIEECYDENESDQTYINKVLKKVSSLEIVDSIVFCCDPSIAKGVNGAIANEFLQVIEHSDKIIINREYSKVSMNSFYQLECRPTYKSPQIDAKEFWLGDNIDELLNLDQTIHNERQELANKEINQFAYSWAYNEYMANYVPPI